MKPLSIILLFACSIVLVADLVPATDIQRKGYSSVSLKVSPLEPEQPPALKDLAKSKKLEWYDDLEEALDDAKRRKLPVLALFTGSDWSPYCIMLEKEVLSKKEFKKYASKNFILYKADLLKKTRQAPELVSRNKKVQEEYSVRGLPTVVLIHFSGKVIATTSYRPGGPEAYIEHLKYLQKK